MRNVWFENLCNCMAGQSVVQRVRAAKASDITCLSSACTSDLFVSVIWPRHFATHSLRPQERNKVQLVRSTTIWKHNKLERWRPWFWRHFMCNLEARVVKWYLCWSQSKALFLAYSSEFECYDPRWNFNRPALPLPHPEMSILRPFKASDMFKFNNVYVAFFISNISLTPSTVTWMSGQKQ